MLAGPYRPTYGDSLASLTEGSYINRWLGGDGSLTWEQAVQADIERTQTFFKKFANDLSLVVARKLRINLNFVLNQRRRFRLRKHMEVLQAEYTYQVHRAADLVFKEISKAIQISDKKLSGYPLTFTQFISSDAAALYCWNSNLQFCKSTLFNISLRPVDDYPRKLKCFDSKLLALQKTHFDFRPMILEGMIIHEKIVQTKHVSKAGTAQALILRLGESRTQLQPLIEQKPDLFLVAGYVSDTPQSWAWNNHRTLPSLDIHIQSAVYSQ